MRVFSDFLEQCGEPNLLVAELKKIHFQKYIKWRTPQKGYQSKNQIKFGTIYKEIYAVRGAFSRGGEYFPELENFEPPPVAFPKDVKSKISSVSRKRIVKRDTELDLLRGALREPRARRQTED